MANTSDTKPLAIGTRVTVPAVPDAPKATVVGYRDDRFVDIVFDGQEERYQYEPDELAVLPKPKCLKCYLHTGEHEAVEHPFKAEVYVDRQWATNALTFATAEDARAYGHELLSRWFVPTDSRVVDTRTGEVVPS